MITTKPLPLKHNLLASLRLYKRREMAAHLSPFTKGWGENALRLWSPGARVMAAWQKWCELSEVMCDSKLPRRLKITIYCTDIHQYMCRERWHEPWREKYLLVMSTKIGIMRWAKNISRRERKTNQEVRHVAGVDGTHEHTEWCPASVVWPCTQQR